MLISFPATSWTVARAVSDDTIIVTPLESSYFHIGSVWAKPENVHRAYDRVDIAEDGRMSFLVEHAVAASVLFGVTTGEIQSLVDSYDLKRPSHVAAASAGYAPSDTFGSADGCIWNNHGDWLLRRVGIVEMLSVDKSFAIDTIVCAPDSTKHLTRIALAPMSGETIRVSCHVGDLSVAAQYKIGEGVVDRSLRNSIASARSIAVKPALRWDVESLMHALGDVMGDIIGIGHIVANIDVTVGYYYHAATHSLRKSLLSENSVVIEVPSPG